MILLDQLTEEQQKFYYYIMDKLQPGKEQEARSIIEEVLTMKQTGTLTKESMMTVGMRLMPLIRFECIADFIKEAQGFAKLLI